VNIAAPIAQSKPTPNVAQAAFLDAISCALDGQDADIKLRLTGGPGTGKSWTLCQAATAAADAGWVVFLVGPTHQATGVLAAAIPQAFPFEPDPKALLSAGEIMFCTAHRLGAWVQKSRSRGAAAGEVDPVPRDSWLGRSFRPSWDARPEGVLVIADESSMYPGQMVAALEATLATLRRECGRVAFVAVGDPHQLTPVRGNGYDYVPGEGPESPSELVTRHDFQQFDLTENVRAKDPELRHVVQTYLTHKTVPVPAATRGAYGWTEATDDAFDLWAELVETEGTDRCIALGYYRASVAAANDKLNMLIDGVPAATLREGRIMRVQETFSPTGSTLAASSDLVTVGDLEMLDDVLALILPPEKGHAPAHDARVLDIVREIIGDEVGAGGPLPVVSVEVHGIRAGFVRRRPVAVASEHAGFVTESAARWASLEGRIAHAAFRKPADVTVRRGLAAIYYHLTDSAKLRLEAPYAMTSHRAQGSTFPHVLVLADSVTGGRVVEHRVASARDASAYVMLSRASESLTIAWKPRLTMPGASFSF
jgi:hypothetical protein